MNFKKKLNITFVVSVVIYFIWIFLPVDLPNQDLNFIKSNVIKIYFSLFVWVYINAIEFSRVEKPNTVKSKKANILVFNLITFPFYAAFMLFIYVITLLGSLSTSEKIIFTNKANQKKVIIKTETGGGAYDSGPPIVGYKLVYPINSFLRHIENIDTNTINKNEWVRVLDNIPKYKSIE